MGQAQLTTLFNNDVVSSLPSLSSASPPTKTLEEESTAAAAVCAAAKEPTRDAEI
jgi:hypothetical protein